MKFNQFFSQSHFVCSLFWLSFFGINLSLLDTAHAFRGPEENLSKSSKKNKPPKTFMKGFPTLSNTEVVIEDEWVLDLFRIGLLYGVTDRFTLGYSLLSLKTNPFFFERYNFRHLISSRYLFYSSSSFSSALSSYVGIPIYQHESLSGFVYHFTQTNSVTLSKRNFLLVHFFSFNEHSSWVYDDTAPIEKAEKNQIHALQLGVGYQHFFSKGFGVEPYTRYFLLRSTQIENPGTVLSTQLVKNRFLYGLKFNIRAWGDSLFRVGWERKIKKNKISFEWAIPL